MDWFFLVGGVLEPLILKFPIILSACSVQSNIILSLLLICHIVKKKHTFLRKSIICFLLPIFIILLRLNLNFSLLFGLSSYTLEWSTTAAITSPMFLDALIKFLTYIFMFFYLVSYMYLEYKLPLKSINCFKFF